MDLSAHLFEAIREDQAFVLYRGRLPDRSAPILVLALASSNPGTGNHERLEREHALGSEIDSAWAARPLGLTDHDGRKALMLSDPGGDPLSRQLGKPLEILHFLNIAIGIAAMLRCVHAAGLVHRDICPANVLVNAAGDAWLTGFSRASRLPVEIDPPSPLSDASDTLPYMAPERTGRMNRSVDTRSDLYSLGVIFYEMLTGVPPFVSDDAMELIHCHIARPPQPPSERAPGIPAALERIVLKLLAKAGEDRYQTAAGIEHDLLLCRAAWQSLGGIAPFELATRDMPKRLAVTDKVFGREAEREAILKCLADVARLGESQFVLVSGGAGVGKSFLVGELRKAAHAAGALVATGKADQQKHAIPYATIAEALADLLHQILSEDAVSLDRWRLALLEALGPNLQLMVNLVPELSLIVGPASPVPHLSSHDEKARFHRVLSRFFSVFATADRPLLIFLDDLQWLDPASLDLLGPVMLHGGLKHVLLVGAYRDDETGPDSPLTSKLRAIEQALAPIVRMKLSPFDLRTVEQLIRTALNSTDPDLVGPLARLILEKTGGNPFFVQQLLATLVDQELLAFDADADAWRFDLEGARAKSISDNVADLMVERLKRLPPTTLKLVTQLACLGSQVSAARCATALGLSELQIQTALSPAIHEGLVVRVAEAYAFAHDRILEAAYELVPESERPAEHLRIGKAIWQSAPAAAPDELVFEALNHLNKAHQAVASAEEREHLAKLNLTAAQRARAATAYVSALSYLTCAKALIGEDPFAERYELAFNLELLAAECEFLTGGVSDADKRLDALSKRATGTGDVAAVACLRMELYTALGKPNLAIDVGLAFLAQVGLEWSLHPSSEAVRRELDRMWALLGARPIEALIDLGPMVDPECLATVAVLAEFLGPATFFDNNLFDLVLLRIANLSIENGNSDVSPFAYALLNIVLGLGGGDYQSALRFGQLGCDLVDKRGRERFRARVYMAFGTFVLPWTKPLPEGQAMLRRAIQLANAAGDLTFEAYSRLGFMSNLMSSGRPLAEIQRDAEEALAFARKARFGLAADCFREELLLICELRGHAIPEGLFEQPLQDRHGFERHLAEGGGHLASAAVKYWIHRIQASVFADDDAAAMQAITKVEELLWSTRSFLEVVEYRFYSALAIASHCRAAPEAQRLVHVQTIKAHLQHIAGWARGSPENCAHRELLIAAEVAALESRDLDAERLYEEAVQSASRFGFVQNEAIASERAARFHAAHGRKTIADVYLGHAVACYRRWGADGTARRLVRLHPGLSDERSSSPEPTTGVQIEHLDFAGAVEISRVLSSEIVLDSLIEKLMTVVVHHAGAARALLLMPKSEEMQVVAAATTGQQGLTVELRGSGDPSGALPRSILQYVTRTRQDVLLEDAFRSGAYLHDEYIVEAHARSILCMPLVSQNRLAGILYLENNLVPFAFTQGHQAFLKLIAAQAAISLENADLYLDLRRTQEQTRRAEAELRRSFDAIPALVWSAWPDGRGDVFNRQWHEYTGIAPGDSDEGWVRSFHPEDVQNVLRKWQELLATGVPGEIEARIGRPNGDFRWFLIRATPVRDETGAVAKWYGTSTDIDDLKRAEALISAEKRLLEMTADGSDLVDILDALVSSVRELTGSPIGLSIVDTTSKTLRHRFAVDLPPSFVALLDGRQIGPTAGSCGAAAYRAEKTFASDIETDTVWADYRDLALDHGLRACWSTPILASDGAVFGTLAIYAHEARDISAWESRIADHFTGLANVIVDRKTTLDALTRSESILAEGQKISHTGSWSWNAASDRILWSEECARIFGFEPSRREVSYLEMLSHVHPDDQKLVEAEHGAAMTATGPFNFEHRIVLSDGTVRLVESRGQVSADENGPSYAGTILDVTEQRKSESEARKLEETLREAQVALAHVARLTAMGELTVSIAHEVNQPLMAIVTNAAACLRWLESEHLDVAEARHAAERIVRDGHRAGEIVANIRALAGKSAVKMSDVDLNEAVREVIVLMRGELRRHGVNTETSLSPDVGTVWADRVQLQQVVMNLMMNGIEAMTDVADGSRILRLASAVGGLGLIEVSVIDSGAGFDPAVGERMFEAFFTTKPAGVGMGLAICRSIIEAHGGRMWAAPGFPSGSEFRFTVKSAGHAIVE